MPTWTEASLQSSQLVIKFGWTSSLVIHKWNKKFKSRRFGPYQIIKKKKFKSTSPTSKIHPVVHVSCLEPYYEDEYGRKPPSPSPSPINVNNEEEL